MRFEKWQGCGNDFVMVDCFTEKISDYSKLAVRLCDRHYGIGADGLIVMLPSEQADLKMRIFNTDGSEAEMCGNGIRCFAKMAYEHKRADKTEFTVETGAGILVPKLFVENGEVKLVKVDMGKPVLTPELVPVDFKGKDRVVSEPIEVDGKEYKMTCVSMGNPHCVVFVDSIDETPVEKLGPLFENHKRFPRKTNTEFVMVKSPSHLRMRVWERGASITLACGTGSCATLVAAVLNGLSENKAEIELDGGTLFVEWEDGGSVYMTGTAEHVFDGEYQD